MLIWIDADSRKIERTQHGVGFIIHPVKTKQISESEFI
jgi:hypothetical protein